MKTDFVVYSFLLALSFACASPVNASPRPGFAIGLGSAFNSLNSVADSNSTQFAPEIFGYGYYHLSNKLWLRPGVRVGFAWQQPSLAHSLQLNHLDSKASLEMGIVWNWVVVPSLTFGGGSMMRSTSVKAEAPIDASGSQMKNISFLPLLYGQFGIGIPVMKGKLMLEPYARYSNIFGDSQYNWAYGAEFSVSLN